VTGIDENKYKLTRKIEAVGDGVPGDLRMRVYPPGSFFPLIRGDALAVMTLRSYANNCLSVIEWGMNPITGDPLLPHQVAHLRELCEDSMQLADAWAKEEPHLPD
jgi:hypothetical protein